MKKYFYLLIFLFLQFNLLFSKKFLILEYTIIKNNMVEKVIYDYTTIDKPFFFKNLKCFDIKFKNRLSIDKIINYLKNKNAIIKAQTISVNNKLKDYVYLKNYFIIDAQYKVLEKNNEKYYIFNVCYIDEKEKKKNILKKLKEFFNE